MNILSCTGVSMAYDSHVVVSDVSFALEAGDYMVIVGENGSGKSTLMKGLLGLIKPISGKIEFYGLNQYEIGYLPQQTVVQKDFPASVFEVVLSGCLTTKGSKIFYRRQDKELAQHNIARLGIDALKRKSYRNLSGGQQQRVLLARALCASERLIVLDEPVNGLDPIMTGDLYSLIAELNHAGLAVIMVSHDVKSAVQFGNKILHMEKKPLFYGAKEDYLHTDICKRMTGGEIYA
ncbi:MAG: ABC transporter ATP-binding protein [Firmicutes bacterium]|nr:ABC transporter ATP-binding protein [Bacillota bacterium]